MGTVTTMLWKTNGIGDGTATGYTDTQTQRLFRALNISNPATMGVIRGEQNELAVSVAGARSLNVATGAALSYGLGLFHDTSVTNLSLPAVAADTAGIVYAEVDWVAQTGSVGFTQAASGTTTTPVNDLVQTAGTTWQIPLASYIMDSAGTVYTDTTKATAGVTDLRQFIGNKSAGGLYKIAEFSGDGTTGVCTFAGIPTGFNDLIIEGMGRSDGAGTVNNMLLTINNDGGANYSSSRVVGQNGAVTHANSISATSILIGDISAASGLTNQADGFSVRIPNYLGTTFNKSIIARSGSRANGTGAGTGQINYNVDGWWHNATPAAISRVTITLSPGGNWATGSKITLYGAR